MIAAELVSEIEAEQICGFIHAAAFGASDLRDLRRLLAEPG
jgi:hypothetical protein